MTNEFDNVPTQEIAFDLKEELRKRTESLGDIQSYTTVYDWDGGDTWDEVTQVIVINEGE